MNRTPPRDPSSVGSFAELRGHYKTLIAQLDECHRQRRAIGAVNKLNRADLLETRHEAKSAKRQVVTMTKAQHAKSKEKSSAAYASVAATTLIIFYQIVEVSGGFGKWQSLFEHEAVIGVLQVLIGTVIAAAMRPLH